MMGQSFHRRSVCKSLVVNGHRRVVGPAHRIGTGRLQAHNVGGRRRQPRQQAEVLTLIHPLKEYDVAQ
jgi:hypothetical protein